MPGKLYLLPCAISDRPAAETLPESTLARARAITHFLAEAAKTARATLKSMGHPKPIAELDIIEIGHQPDPAAFDRWLAPALAGEDIAIVSESGCPGVADPGAQIVARAHALGIRVVPLTGPSSILLALMASGLDGQHFRFCGYLPKHEAERRAAVLAAENASRAGETQIFIETPYRNEALLETLIDALSPGTLLTAAADITGESESIRTLSVGDWRQLSPEERTLPRLPTIFAFLAEPGRGLQIAPWSASDVRESNARRKSDEAAHGRPRKASSGTSERRRTEKTASKNRRSGSSR